MTWLLLLKKFWPFLLAGLLLLAILGGLRWFASVVTERGELRDEVAALEAQIALYKKNATTVEQLREEVKTCLDRVEDAQRVAEEWQRRYNARPRRDPIVVEVPVEVSAPGTPCDQAVAEIAAWLAAEVQHVH